MRIAVLGTGTVGRAIAGRLDDLGHDVVVGTRDPDATIRRAAEPTGDSAFRAWADTHPAVEFARFADAVAGSEVIANATSGGATLAVLDQVGAAQLEAKIVMDVSNPLDFTADGLPSLLVKDTDSLGEQIQRAFPAARVVKTLNTMNASLMVEPAQLADGDHSVFVSGNDADAKATVTRLLHSFGHTDVVDLGDITTARGAEMMLPLWLRLMNAMGTMNFNIKVVR